MNANLTNKPKSGKRTWQSITRELLAVSVGLLSFGLAPLIADAQNVTSVNYKFEQVAPQVQERFLNKQNTSEDHAGISHNIGDYVQPSIQDISLTLKTGQYNQKAGEKISKEFGLGYKLSGNGTMLYMQPNLIRLDGRLIGMKAKFIMDGFTQKIHVGFINQTQDHSKAPGKVTTLLDLGLLNNFYLTYTTAQYMGTRQIDGAECALFRLSYQPGMQDTSFRLVWIDTKEHMIRRREEHKQDGTLHAIYLYRNPVQIQGAWIPTEVDAINADGEFVGQTFIQNPRLNTGITEASFH